MHLYKKILFTTGAIFFAAIFFINVFSSCNTTMEDEVKADSASLWYGWNQYQIKPEDTLVRLGHDIITNTYAYFGPHGKVAAITNGMNCQNCHINGGIVPWGNNFGAVIISYPKSSARMGAIMSLSRRINDCFERSLNGMAIDTNGREMQAMIAYMHWLDDGVKQKPAGSGIMKLAYLDRAADTAKGKLVYISSCQRCHGKNGEGQQNEKGGFVYPPLWGDKSYNTGAGIYRLSMLAGFIKNNMPYEEALYNHTVLTNEEAWDVSAFINSQPRPVIKNKKDYPDISKKEVDNPVGPYSDTFPELQHKYGPFKEIAAAHEAKNR